MNTYITMITFIILQHQKPIPNYATVLGHESV